MAVRSDTIVVKLVQGLLVGLGGVLLALTLWSSGWLESWEAKTWDWRASVLAEPGAATDDIRLILLDQNSLDWALKENGLTWPWPREIYGAIVNFCRRGGAKAVAFDVLFTEPSKYGVSDDAAFAAAVSDFGHFAGALFLGNQSGSRDRWPPDLPLPPFTVEGLFPRQPGSKAISFSRASLPIPELATSAAILCNTHIKPDRDGIYRRVPLLGLFAGYRLPTLGIGAYLAAEPQKTAFVRSQKLMIGDRAIPIDSEFRAILRFRGPSGTHRTFSAAAVLQSEIRLQSGQKPPIHPVAAFRDKYVFFGFSAPGLYDLRSAPVGGVYPGVEIHATLLDNFLSGDFIRAITGWPVVLTIAFLGLACGITATFFSSPLGIITTGALLLPVPLGLSLAAYFQGFWLPLVAPEVAIVTALILAPALNYATEGRQKRFIKNAFKQYLSPTVIEQLIQNPKRLKLGGERRTLSIFFSDLQGFTSISEGLEPEALTQLLNDYLSAMTDIIQEENGTVDKYEGDAIIAFWNAPIEVPDHALRVVRAALRCQARLAELRPVFKDRIGKELWMRIGINTGPAVVGNMGSQTRFDYTVLGDSVNLAARLEGINKQFGTYTMISQATRELTGSAFAVRELARVAVVGRKEAVTVYEPMLPQAYAENKIVLEAFDYGLALFYRGEFDAALAVFSSLKDRDPVAAAYARKCRQLSALPPADWQGIWVMTEK